MKYYIRVVVGLSLGWLIGWGFEKTVYGLSTLSVYLIIAGFGVIAALVWWAWWALERQYPREYGFKWSNIKLRDVLPFLMFAWIYGWFVWIIILCNR